MDALTAWRPFRELERMRREMERHFSRIVEAWPLEEVRAGYYPQIESFTRGENIIVHVDLPGIDPNDLEISLFHDVLTIRGERKATVEAKPEDHIRRELAYGPFERRIALPEGSAADKVQATFKNGVVEITIPMTKEIGARKIPLEVAAEKTKSDTGVRETTTGACPSPTTTSPSLYEQAPDKRLARCRQELRYHGRNASAVGPASATGRFSARFRRTV